MTTEREEPPGRQATAEFFESLTEMEGVDKEVAETLSQLYASGYLDSRNILAALRKARLKDSSQDNGENQKTRS